MLLDAVIPERKTLSHTHLAVSCSADVIGRAGKGKLTFEKGYYEGEFVHGRMCGHGEYLYPNGNKCAIAVFELVVH